MRAAHGDKARTIRPPLHDGRGRQSHEKACRDAGRLQFRAPDSGFANKPVRVDELDRPFMKPVCVGDKPPFESCKIIGVIHRWAHFCCVAARNAARP
jgi:hypothetical protein